MIAPRLTTATGGDHGGERQAGAAHARAMGGVGEGARGERAFCAGRGIGQSSLRYWRTINRGRLTTRRSEAKPRWQPISSKGAYREPGPNGRTGPVVSR
jgi:hypothetical protein